MRKGSVRRMLAAVSLTLGMIGVGLGVAPAAQSAPAWAPAATATIHPGVMMFTEGAQCTANFVFTQGDAVFIGYAAHCAGTGAATDTNGCDAPSLPLGTPVEIDGASQPGTLAYSSWVTMQNQPTRPDADTCAYNDLALVRVAAADVGKVNPSIPHWGGPVGLNTDGNPIGSSLYTYGNSSLRLGITQLSPKTGISLGTTGAGWSHPAYTLSPGIPGDSGSAFLDSQGRATGVLSTLAVAPLPLSNNAGDLAHELAYAAAHGFGVTLVNGTEPFNPSQLPLALL